MIIADLRATAARLAEQANAAHAQLGTAGTLYLAKLACMALGAVMALVTAHEDRTAEDRLANEGGKPCS